MPLAKPMILAVSGAILLGGAAAVHATQGLSARQTDKAPFSKAEIEQIVRNYILENPEILFEAADRYSAQQAGMMQQRMEDAARDSLPTLLSASAGFAVGADVAETEVLVVEFFDYHCGFCRRATDFVFDLTTKDAGIRLVLQELPVVHQNSRDVALAALAAPDAQSYANIHRALMDISGVITADQVASIAKKARIDYKPFADRLAAEDVKAAIDAKLSVSIDMAREIGIDGTPGFVIATPDGRFVRIISGFDEEAVRAAIAEARGA